MKWPMVKLADVCQVNPRLPKEYDETQDVSFLAMASVSEDGILLNQETRVLSETKKGFTYFERGDVIVAKITPCFENGKAAYLDSLQTQVGFGSTEFHVLRPDIKQLDGKYLFYLIWNQKFRFIAERSMSGSAGQKRVPASFLQNFEVPLPPLKEQKRITAILDKADAIRQKRQQVIALADDFLRSIFLDMFGDPITNPKGWERVKLGDLISSGPTNGLYKPSSSYGSGTRILRIDGFYDGILSEQKHFKRVEISKEEKSRFSLIERGIVINRVNSPEYLGKCAFIDKLHESTVFESNMMFFTVDEELLNPVFLTQQLQMPNIKQQIKNCSKDAVNQSSINQQDVKSFEILLPNVELQNDFEAVVNEVTRGRERVSNGQSLTDALFNSISHQVFSGQL
ncbi:restriction endonuclease subunit S [Aeromonas veronii]|uniref:restriction endonuclease subunit S n=1 Tax=Aeromonas veronii TaxID=654 RepID=UPI0038EC72CB